jgi:hypothetical protein
MAEEGGRRIQKADEKEGNHGARPENRTNKGETT